ncbi:expressed unknown protein [Seminavis robusta]|uniref:peptidylprolyl isomerase n=1 Tax=Seminavis robusta TaxID=568900 RepID=A0A9N8D8L6_9STRA|nr:expressed unknown protein [Seminavis robusta]|eukprot:Sro2_g001470.1 n/a (178) ;mRNA; r:161609-162142
MMRCLLALSSLLALAYSFDIGVKVTGGPSKQPATRCYNYEEIERGDVVVIHFNVSYHETSPSGNPGDFITSSSEHTANGGPFAVPVGDVNHKDGWDLALLGYCEGDFLTLTVPPKYIHGEIFEGKNVPGDAILEIDVHVEDILVDDGEGEEEEWDYMYGEEDSDEDEDYDEDMEEEL